MRPADSPLMEPDRLDVAVTGASGMIGTALVAELEGRGHRVRRLVRRAPRAGEVRWDPSAGTIDVAGLAGIDAAVHLAGESIAAGRWTPEQKRRILESRTDGTRVLATALAALDPLPAAFLSGSGIDYYGDAGDTVLTETSPKGQGFLSDVVEAWEDAAAPAADAGIRTVLLRTSMVLSASEGAMARMLPIFRLGLGGRMGNGRQWWPWITLDDEVGAIVHLLTADVEGPVNLVAPGVVTNAEFTRALGRVLRRPTLVPVPIAGPALLFGHELARTLLADSKRANPAKLVASGYEFHHPTVDQALNAVLG